MAFLSALLVLCVLTTAMTKSTNKQNIHIYMISKDKSGFETVSVIADREVKRHDKDLNISYTLITDENMDSIKEIFQLVCKSYDTNYAFIDLIMRGYKEFCRAPFWTDYLNIPYIATNDHECKSSILIGPSNKLYFDAIEDILKHDNTSSGLMAIFYDETFDYPELVSMMANLRRELFLFNAAGSDERTLLRQMTEVQKQRKTKQFVVLGSTSTIDTILKL
ncbi:unnamed protein product, partial [Owenia fusiformis]